MTAEEALKVIKYHQEWRKGGDVPQTDTTKLTEALDLLPKVIESKDREMAELKSIIFNEKAKYKKFVAAMLEEVEKGKVLLNELVSPVR